MKLITSDMLCNACIDQQELFRKTFPDGAPVTEAAARKARKTGLDVGWLSRLLSPSLYDEYWAKRKPLDDEYWAKCDALLVTYLRKVKEEEWGEICQSR